MKFLKELKQRGCTMKSLPIYFKHIIIFLCFALSSISMATNLSLNVHFDLIPYLPNGNGSIEAQAALPTQKKEVIDSVPILWPFDYVPTLWPWDRIPTIWSLFDDLVRDAELELNQEGSVERQGSPITEGSVDTYGSGVVSSE